MSSTFWVFVLFSLIMINCLWLSRCFGFFVRFKSLPGWYKRTHLIIQIDTSALHIFFIRVQCTLARCYILFATQLNGLINLMCFIFLLCWDQNFTLNSRNWRNLFFVFHVHWDFNANKNWRSINTKQFILVQCAVTAAAANMLEIKCWQ